MANKNDIDKKVSDILDSIDVDADIVDIGDELPDFSNLLNDVSEDSEISSDKVFGNWKIIRSLGQGGMSHVYLVERNDGQIDLQAALKVIPRGMADVSLKQRFKRERQILTDLNHPNIAKLYDAGISDNNIPWFVMEYIEGMNIIDYAEKNYLNQEQRIILFRQVCEALAYSHSQGIIHRDIKPGNILVNKEGQVKLLDFGIAADEENSSLTMTGVVVGTPGYLSPEQAKGLTHEVDRRTDIFSLGVLLYKLIQKSLPFEAGSISEISYKTIHSEPSLLDKKIPAELQAIIYKCLEKNAEDRYSSVRKLIADLEAYLNGDVVSARKITIFLRVGKKIRKNPLLSALTAFSVLAVLISIAYGVYSTYESLKKIQIAEKHLSTAQEIKAKVRRTHMMPKHNVQNEYQQLRKEIEQLQLEIQHDKSNTTGLSSFALGSAYLAMRDYNEAFKLLLDAETKGWKSSELSAELGVIYAYQWENILHQALSIDDVEKKKQFLQKNKELIYDKAIDHLTASQNETTISNYLSAKLAYMEKEYDESIVFIKREIENNPWHYEAMAFASTIYNAKYQKTGENKGYENAFEYKEISDEYLQNAIEIGESDPTNYLQYCSNLKADVRKNNLKLTQDIYQVFEKSERVCKEALSLNPYSKLPYINLGVIYADMADYLELNKKPFFKMEEQSYLIVNQGLKKFPNDSELLATSVGSLFSLAWNINSIQKESPEIIDNLIQTFDIPFPEDSEVAEKFFLQALNNINKALSVNPVSLEFRKKHAEVHRALGIYHEEQTRKYDLADSHYDEALASFKEMEKLGGYIASTANVAEMYYNKSLLRSLQGKPDEAISFIKKAIELNDEVLDITKVNFAAYNNTMQFHYVLVETLKKNNRNYDWFLPEAFEFVNKVCNFDYLEELHWYIIDDVINSYQKLGVETGKQFYNCEMAKLKELNRAE